MKKNNKPHILINIATHGNERIGFYVKKELEKIKIEKGFVEFNIANEKAYLKNRRFIDQDLNRSFPGKRNGNHEQKLAYTLSKKIKKADLVLDIHSTTSTLKDAIIITKDTKGTMQLLNVIKPKYVLYMSMNKQNALISSAKIGLAFEYGKDNDRSVIQKTVRDIKIILSYYGVIDSKLKKKKTVTRFFKIKKEFQKNKGEKLKKEISNYKLVKKGSVVVYSKHGDIRATEDFIPILFGENNYEKIFGFIGKEYTIA